jgi:hypothetical protein
LVPSETEGLKSNFSYAFANATSVFAGCLFQREPSANSEIEGSD